MARDLDVRLRQNKLRDEFEGEQSSIGLMVVIVNGPGRDIFQ
jgi:hypothetical protein